MNTKQLIKSEAERLAEFSDEAKTELRILLEEITGRDYMGLLFSDAEISDADAEKIRSYVTRLVNGEPIQYILGHWSFMGNDFIVTPDVLIPRADTEISTELAINRIKTLGNVNVLDLCSGSGCIGISIAKACKNATVTCGEISQNALEIIKKNIKLNGVMNNTRAIYTDMFSCCASYDVIISNPPYIPTDVIRTLDNKVKNNEPMLALDGGEDGLYFYRIIAMEAKRHLNKNGILLLEIGYDQGESVKTLLQINGFGNIKCIKDYSGNDRVITAEM